MVHVIAKTHGSTNVASVSGNIRGKRLDPLTIRSLGVLQESADFSARASYNIKINEKTWNTNDIVQKTTAPIRCPFWYQASSAI